MFEQALPPELEVFRKDVGTWDAMVEVRIHPGASPMISQGRSVSRLAHGGRWLVTEFENETGFSGTGIYGFDVGKKRYTGVWVDTTRTSIIVMDGTYDAATKKLTLNGEMKRPDGGVVPWREVTETVDADTQIFRSYMPAPDGNEFEMMTVTYRRASA